MVKNYSTHKISLTKAQAKKLAKNQNILLKPSDMTGGAISIYMNPNKYRRMMTASRKNKGMKFGLNQDELERTMEGQGFKDLLKKGVKTLSKEVKPVASKLIEKAKPVVQKQVSKALEKTVGKKTADKIGSVVAKGGEKLAKKALKIKDKPASVSVAEPEPVIEEEDDDFNPLNMYDAVGGRLRRGIHLSGHDKIIGNDMRGGKLNLKKIGSEISKGYKKYVKDTVIGDTLRSGLKNALVAGASRIGGPTAGIMAEKYGDTLIEKAGLGVLQSNHSNFLNTFHPAMNPHIPIQGYTDIPRVGGSFLPAGQIHRGGSFLPAGGRIYRGGRILSNNPMNPKIPEQGITDVPRDENGMPMKMYNPSTGFFAGSQ